MNKLWRNLRYDSRAGFGGNFIYYIGWIVVSILLVCFVFSVLKELSPDNVPGCFDIVSGFFLGVEENDIFERTERLEIPFEWLLLHIYILFGIARYPKQDFDECGYNVWLRIRSKKAWWVSKVVWCFVHVVVTYLSWLLVVVAAEACLGGDMTFEITNIHHLRFSSEEQFDIYAAVFLMPIIVDFAIGMIVLASSFAFDSAIGLLAGIAVLLTSVFFHNRLLLGRYMMLYSYFSERSSLGFTIKEGLILCACVIFCASVLGYVFYAGKER